MKTIVLLGDSNCGKTTILKSLIVRLIKRKSEVLFLHGKPINPISDIISKWFNTKEEVRDMNIILKHKNKTVAITTLGDNLKAITGAFEMLCGQAKNKGKAIDVFICAAHDKPEIISWLNGLAENPDDIQFVEVYDMVEKMISKI